MTLYQTLEDCCGCGSCAATCPRHAITMKPDELGFYYPRIDTALCVECGICKSACDFQRVRGSYTPRAVYAAMRKNTQALLKSSSGGAFAVFAEAVLRNNGAVFGAVLKKETNGLFPCHCIATNISELSAMFGSKYVQSNLQDTFMQAKRRLDDGQVVLFSGTPCQIGGLKSFLKKDYSNLLTIDLVCHGVPSARIFQDYLRCLEEKLGGPIVDFKFRDKSLGWGLNAKVDYQDRIGNVHVKHVPSYQSSYYEYFLKSELYRDSCYSCPYAGKQRPADISLGDFWGFEIEHPEASALDGAMNTNLGISLVMINTCNGAKWFELCQDDFISIPSDIDRAAKHNGQLMHPSTPGENREQILKLYQLKGYKAVDIAFVKEKKVARRKEELRQYLHNNIPKPVRDLAKKLLRGN